MNNTFPKEEEYSFCLNIAGKVFVHNKGNSDKVTYQKYRDKLQMLIDILDNSPEFEVANSNIEIY